jgi:hypothetical protein
LYVDVRRSTAPVNGIRRTAVDKRDVGVSAFQRIILDLAKLLIKLGVRTFYSAPHNSYQVHQLRLLYGKTYIILIKILNSIYYSSPFRKRRKFRRVIVEIRFEGTSHRESTLRRASTAKGAIINNCL